MKTTKYAVTAALLISVVLSVAIEVSPTFRWVAAMLWLQAASPAPEYAGLKSEGALIAASVWEYHQRNSALPTSLSALPAVGIEGPLDRWTYQTRGRGFSLSTSTGWMGEILVGEWTNPQSVEWMVYPTN